LPPLLGLFFFFFALAPSYVNLLWARGFFHN
jgi:hypothetical protein